MDKSQFEHIKKKKTKLVNKNKKQDLMVDFKTIELEIELDY